MFQIKYPQAGDADLLFFIRDEEPAAAARAATVRLGAVALQAAGRMRTHQQHVAA